MRTVVEAMIDAFRRIGADMPGWVVLVYVWGSGVMLGLSIGWAVAGGGR